MLLFQRLEPLLQGFQVVLTRLGGPRGELHLAAQGADVRLERPEALID
jgi:hypothetical protein